MSEPNTELKRIVKLAQEEDIFNVDHTLTNDEKSAFQDTFLNFVLSNFDDDIYDTLMHEDFTLNEVISIFCAGFLLGKNL